MTTSSAGSISFGRDSRRGDALLLALLTLLALLLRAVRLDFQPLWWDEGYSVWFAHQALGEMLRLTALDIHPPLYYALLGAWARGLGWDPVALRWLSVAVGAATVPLIYLVGDWLSGRRVGLVAAFLLATNPLHIFYAQEVRMYALVALWALLALGAAGRWLGLGRRIRGDTQPAAWGWLAGYVAAITLALYTQYYAAFLLLGLTAAGVPGAVAAAGRPRADADLAGSAGRGAAALRALAALRHATPDSLYLAEDRRRLGSAAGLAALPGAPSGGLQRRPSGGPAGRLVAVGAAGAGPAGGGPGAIGASTPAGAGPRADPRLPGHHRRRGVGAGLAGQSGLSLLSPSAASGCCCWACPRSCSCWLPPGLRQTPCAAGASG
jgi:hypothetical protein